MKITYDAAPDTLTVVLRRARAHQRRGEVRA